jgi:hypothetical protein
MTESQNQSVSKKDARPTQVPIDVPELTVSLRSGGAVSCLQALMSTDARLSGCIGIIECII